MRVLLTGGSGFIGSHLLDALADHDVVALTRRALPPRPHVTNVVAGLDDPDVLRAALDGCDAVLHLAAVSNAAAAAADPLGCIATNVVATARLAALAAELGVSRFVFTSTGLVYGQPSVLPITEDTLCEPQGVYPSSKLAAEHLVAALHPSALLVRVFNVYGPRQTGTLVPALVGKLRAGETVTLQGDGSQIRSFLYVTDATDALRRALESDATGVLDLAGPPASILEVYRAVASALGCPLAPEFAPARPGDPKESWASSRRLAEQLGWHPTVALADGIARTVAG